MRRCRRSSTIVHSMSRRQMRDRSLSLSPSTKRRCACLTLLRRKLVRYGSILSGNSPARYGTPGGIRTAEHPSLKSSTRPGAITSSSIRALSKPVKMPLPACAQVNWPITCVRRGRKSGVFWSWRKAARSICGPRPSKARSSPGSKREQARQRFCEGGPAQVEYSALASLLHEFDNTIGDLRIIPSGCGDGLVRFHRQPSFLDSTRHLSSGLHLELLGFLGTVSLLHPCLPLRANLLDLERCGRKGFELVLTGLELLGRGLLLSWLGVLRLHRQSKSQDEGASQDGGKGQNGRLDFHGKHLL